VNRIQRYEKIYLILYMGVAILGVISVTIYDIVLKFENELPYHLIWISIFGLFLYIKYAVYKKCKYDFNETYFILKLIDLVMPVIGIAYFHLGEWIYGVTIITLIFATITKGRNTGVLLMVLYVPINILIFGLHDVFLPNEVSYIAMFSKADELVKRSIFAIAYILTVVLCGKVYFFNKKNEEENKLLLQQLGEKYQQLAVAQEEIKTHNDKLRETNSKLEDSNKKLTSSIAEFYTLQQISQAISSILDIKELLKYVNDIILGVMGVNYSTIILFDEKRMKLKVHTTNIKTREDLVTLSDNINNEILFNALNNGKSIIENFVDDEEYVFTKAREVNSLILVPLNTKSRKYGLVLIEHKYYSAFDDENVRLLETIGQQVGIAMENAELYQKMQELATIDGLTGVYNRLFFQERLPREFKAAQEENYSLTLAIFDIDHFKRFNDTYGHLFGDKVLKIIADIVNKSLRNSDIFARYGGEEFIILFPRTNLKEACDKVELLREEILCTCVKDNLVSASITVSFGIASFPENARTENELIKLADDALFEAKDAGRNCVRIAKEWTSGIATI
jgi:diguanylate cyclase (GGDEF)-like protein